ncbi:MarR family winged helix-turn-helix transcriptional regulator [Sphingomonas sp.]|uniref:MarR family winged helix-turn-helix transcriptional regulator n=1 Tax=Sphingomonas sp. TaxID=28214 RepID=UPI003D6D1CAB
MKDQGATRTRRKRIYALAAGSDALDLADHLPFGIAVLANLLRVDRDPYVRQLTSLGARELRVLLNIGSYMPVAAADIAYQARLDTHTVSRAVKTLLAQGLIEIQQHDLDRRLTLLTLNETGQALYREVARILDIRAKKLVDVLDPSEAIAMAGMLERLEDRAEQLLAEAALDLERSGMALSADQRELVRWYKKGSAADGP